MQHSAAKRFPSLYLLSAILAVGLLGIGACDFTGSGGDEREIEGSWSTVVTVQGTTTEIEMTLDENDGDVEGEATSRTADVSRTFGVVGTYQAPDVNLQFDPSGDPEGPSYEATVSKGNQRLEGTLEGPRADDLRVVFERE